MPGKVNPVIPMMTQRIAFTVRGNVASIALASLNGQLEINYFEPIMAARLFETTDILSQGCRIFADYCIEGISGDREQALENLMGSSALAMVLLSKLRNAEVSKVVRVAGQAGVSFKDVLVQPGLMTCDDIKSNLTKAAITEVSRHIDERTTP